MDEAQKLILQRYTAELPVRVGALAKELGLKVVKSRLEPKISGQIGPSEEAPAGYEIKVNMYESAERQRFTLAHEIAHFLLHRDRIGRGISDTVLYRSTLGSRIETEANKLAADIVMPSDQINQALRSTSSVIGEAEVEKIARDFKVSKSAMRIRLGLS